MRLLFPAMRLSLDGKAIPLQRQNEVHRMMESSSDGDGVQATATSIGTHEHPIVQKKHKKKILPLVRTKEIA